MRVADPGLFGASDIPFTPVAPLRGSHDQSFGRGFLYQKISEARGWGQVPTDAATVPFQCLHGQTTFSIMPIENAVYRPLEKISDTARNNSRVSLSENSTAPCSAPPPDPSSRKMQDARWPFMQNARKQKPNNFLTY
jgi:hypothetical protein